MSNVGVWSKYTFFDKITRKWPLLRQVFTWAETGSKQTEELQWFHEYKFSPLSIVEIDLEKVLFFLGALNYERKRKICLFFTPSIYLLGSYRLDNERGLSRVFNSRKRHRFLEHTWQSNRLVYKSYKGRLTNSIHIRKVTYSFRKQ